MVPLFPGKTDAMFQIEITSVTTSSSDIGIDDIKLGKSFCQNLANHAYTFNKIDCNNDTSFQCHRPMNTCISNEYVCDGRPDCPDESDESKKFCGNL